ncbi:protein of unknown function [Azospirillum lipoferum 4B]|uniref:Uncharacterized protein n=1 Tax=Azospirillum lipoferum (strain 4B) TaxID=862719 RepID=G7Z1R0_AZOL4|nr:protein of unknown function [Azospirillum lipoferum 4B]
MARPFPFLPVRVSFSAPAPIGRVTKSPACPKALSGVFP